VLCYATFVYVTNAYLPFEGMKHAEWPQAEHENAPQASSVIWSPPEGLDIECRSLRAKELSTRPTKL
jgi:hypothetical protein